MFRIRQLRLAKVKTMQAANEFLEKEYWPEWNGRFARSLTGVTDVHRPLTPQIDLAASLSHVEPRVISNDYTFSFAGRRYQIVRGDVQAGMKRQSLRVELRLDGELHARYQSRYLEIHECGAKKPAEPATGTFYFAGNRNFLLCLDTTGCPRVRTWRANPRLHLEV